MKRLFTILVVVALAAAVGGSFAVWQLRLPYRTAGLEPVIFELPAGESPGTTYRRLAEAGLVRSARLARWVHRLECRAQPLRAGEYEFDRPLSPAEVLGVLIEGRGIQHRVTLREGLDRWAVIEVLAGAFPWLDRERLAAAIADPAPIRDLAPTAVDLEGYLFPETYAFARGTDERTIVAKLAATFREQWQAATAAVVTAPPERGVHELVTLASIVEWESAVAAERPRIAGVYSNRLRIGMPLQADPTVIYALKLAGTWDGDIRRRDLTVASPYNTYVVAGLPPGPIGNPGRGSLEAVLAPSASKELYFVSKNDGTHVFSDDYAAHQRAVEVWQKAYWRKKWAEQRGR